MDDGPLGKGKNQSWTSLRWTGVEGDACVRVCIGLLSLVAGHQSKSTGPQ